MGFPPKLAPGWCNILLSPKTPDSRGRGGPHSEGPHDGDQTSFSTDAVQAVFRVLLSQCAFLSNSFRYKKSWEGIQ